MHLTKRPLEGREHVVVPCVMMVEGVHRGSRGPLFYSTAELSKSAPFWNGRPVVVYHPSLESSQGGSAGDPEVFNGQRIGTIFNARMDRKRLLAEAWIDLVRAAEVDGRVIKAIVQKSMMELSTGVFTDNEMTEGVWNGEDYIGIATNLRADHLAVLPDQKGACSIADGAGFIRNASVNVLEPLFV